MDNTVSHLLASDLNNSGVFESFNKQTQQLIKTNELGQDTFIKEHRQAIMAGSAVAGAAAVAVTTFAYLRGRKFNLANGNESKLFSNISEGFKSFFNKGKANRNNVVSAKNTNTHIDNEINPAPLSNISKEEFNELYHAKFAKLQRLDQECTLLVGGKDGMIAQLAIADHPQGRMYDIGNLASLLQKARKLKECIAEHDKLLAEAGELEKQHENFSKELGLKRCRESEDMASYREILSKAEACKAKLEALRKQNQ